MLEACVNRNTGEIIVVKPGKAKWSAAERDGHTLCVVKLDDSAVKVGPTGVRAYPYAEYGLDVSSESTITNISRVKVPPGKLTPGALVSDTDLVDNVTVPRG